MVWWMLAEDVSPPSQRCSAKSKNSCCGISHEQQHNLMWWALLMWSLCRCVHTGCVGGSQVQRRAALRGLALRNAKTEQTSGTEARRPLGLCVKLEMNRKVFQQNTETGLWKRWFLINWKRKLQFLVFLVMQVVTSFNQCVTGVGCSSHERSTKCALNTTESVVLYMILLLNVTFHLLLK